MTYAPAHAKRKKCRMSESSDEHVNTDDPILRRTSVNIDPSIPLLVYSVDSVIVGIEGKSVNDIGCFVATSLMGGLEAAADMSRALISLVLRNDDDEDGASRDISPVDRLTPVHGVVLDNSAVVEATPGQSVTYNYQVGFQRHDDYVADLGLEPSLEEVVNAIDVIHAPEVARGALDLITEHLDSPAYLNPIDDTDKDEK